MSDYSKMSDEKLIDNICHYRKLIYGNLRLDEDTDDVAEKRYFALKGTLNEMEEEAKRRKIDESQITNQIYKNQIEGEERKQRIKYELETISRISDTILNNPSDLFESEEIVLRGNSQFRNRIQSRVINKISEIMRNYELLKREDRNTVLKLPEGKETIRKCHEQWATIIITDTAYVLYVPILEEIDPPHPKLPDSYKDYEKYLEIIRNLYWVNGRFIAKEYSNGVEFLAEKIQKGEVYKINLQNLLDFGKAELIAKSFSSPVFMYWFYEGKLPAYSWSAQNGEPMMRALVSGDYRKCYNAERRLIKRVVRDIGERYN